MQTKLTAIRNCYNQLVSVLRFIIRTILQESSMSAESIHKHFCNTTIFVIKTQVNPETTYFLTNI